MKAQYHTVASWVNKVGGRKLQLSDRQLHISDSKISIKSIKNFRYEFLYRIKYFCKKNNLKFTRTDI